MQVRGPTLMQAVATVPFQLTDGGTAEPVCDQTVQYVSGSREAPQADRPLTLRGKLSFPLPSVCYQHTF